jgi:hypothetical protein
MGQWNWSAVGLVALCIGLRWWLVWSGGQFWFPDEKRFWWSGLVVYHLTQGHWKQALVPILEWNQHPGFTCLGCVPTAIYWVWARWNGLPYADVPFEQTVKFGAVFLSLASVICVVLIGAIVRRAGGGRGEALLAMGLMAASNTMFYYSRHVLPYDASLALALASLVVGMRQGRFWRVLLSGWLPGAAFMTYYGYWVTVIVVLGTVVTWKADTIKEVGNRLLWFGVGALSWVGLFECGCRAVIGRSFLGGTISFARVVLPPLYGEGWSTPWIYLWYAEHGLLIFWLGALAAILWIVGVKRQVAGHGVTWVAMAGAMYLLLILSSVVLHAFVVYGRTARQLVPILCLIGAFAGGCVGNVLRAEVRNHVVKLGIIALVLQAAWNFRVPLGQWFPPEVKSLVAAQYAAASQVLTVNSPNAEEGPATAGSSGATSRYVLVNAQYLARFSEVKAIPPGVVLLRFAHPTEFKPHQYEEFTRAQRDILRQTDISMRLVDTALEPKLANPPTIP